MLTLVDPSPPPRLLNDPLQRHLDICAHCRSSSLAADINVVGAIQTTLHTQSLLSTTLVIPPESFCDRSLRLLFRQPGTHSLSKNSSLRSRLLRQIFSSPHQRYRFVTGTSWSFAYNVIHDPSTSAINITGHLQQNRHCIPAFS